MFRAVRKGLGIILHSITIRVLFLSLLVALLFFIVFWFLAGYLFLNNDFFNISWLETLSDALGGVALLVLTWFLFPAVLSASVTLFLNQIVTCVEKKYYPGLAPIQEISILYSIMPFLRFLTVLIVLNLLVFSLLVFFTPAFPFVFFAVNGYLISREYFELVGLRRFSFEQVTSMRKQYTWKLSILGVLITALLMVPILNLLAPIVATSVMVHLIEELKHAEPHLVRSI